jgi:hypothetical protein
MLCGGDCERPQEDALCIGMGLFLRDIANELVYILPHRRAKIKTSDIVMIRN